MNKLFSVLLGIVLTTAAFAQAGKTIITGTVKNSDGKLLEATTVTLLHMPDKKIVKINITNAKGEFEFINIAEGSYQLLLTAVGYQAAAPTPVTIKAGQDAVAVNVAPLTVAFKNLGDVLVQSKLKMVETKADKTVVNVDAMISNAGSSALDVLEKSPGVLVDRDGNISLKGKQGVIIMIDGKPSYLGGQDLANYLRNLPSTQLDQFEIMTQPSAKYDASGNSGIINIKTKKSKMNGFNGNVSLSYIQGVYPKSVNSVGLNWRKNKLNVFLNYSHSYWQAYNDISIYRTFRKADTVSSIFDQQTNNQRFSRSNNLKTGLDYTLNKTTTLGVVLNGTYDPRTNFSNGFTNILNGQKQVDSINRASTTDQSIWKNFGANVNLRKVLNGKGREITADADYILYRSISNQNSNNTMYKTNGELNSNPFLLNGRLPGSIDIYSLKTDYTHPIDAASKIEAGLKTSLVKTDNNAIYTTYDHTVKVWVADNNRSNHFLYNENINAAYINYNRQMKKWGIQAGLRVENTNGKGQQLRDKTEFTRHYTQLFPTAYLSHNLNDNNTFTLSYGRRINRPNYQDLNPFIYFLDQYTYNQGNPYLLPQFSNNIELSHNFKGKLTTTLNFTATNNIINDILVQNDTSKVTYQTKQNIARQTNTGLAISYNALVTKWYTISAYGNGFVNHFSGIVNNRPLDVTVASFMLNMNNQFRFKGGWGAEMSGWFRSKTQDAGVIVALPMGVLNFAVSKQILQNKGTIKLGLNDGFRLQRFHGYTKFDNIDADIRSIADSRRLAINFSYRFGKNMQQQTRRRNGSAQDEQNRAGGGNGNG